MPNIAHPKSLDHLATMPSYDQHRPRANGSRALLGSISAIALIAGLGAGLAPALAQFAEDVQGSRGGLTVTSPQFQGVNADKSILPWNSDRRSTAGSDGWWLTYRNFGSIGQTSGTAVSLNSTGGRGGEGDASGFFGSLPASNGGRGGDITFEQRGTIVPGWFSGVPLIWLLSQGGEGGEGGVSRGERNGDGGAAGSVRFVHSGSKIDVSAPQPVGTAVVWVQSRGGNGAEGLALDTSGIPRLTQEAGAGGSGGSASAEISGEIAASGQNLAAVKVSAEGGSAGKDGVLSWRDRANGRGGNGGTARLDVTASGKISTNGSNAPAVIVEARGGDAPRADEASNGRAADGGLFFDSLDNPSVRVTSRGTITTAGELSTAIVAQSIGGNGGEGGPAGNGVATNGGLGGNAGRVVIDQAGKVATAGSNSYGILAQSIGGSGGKGGDGSVFGAHGGRAGDGNVVVVTNTGSVVTEGEGATAIVAQSIGGGKALDAFNAKLPTPKGGSTGPGGGAGGIADSWFFGKGGDGGGGGNGNLVEVQNGGDLTTQQAFAYGILAQSIGGGGGDGGVAQTSSAFFSVALGGGGGGGGDGGPVQVNGRVAVPQGAAAPSITTHGKDAIAIFAQSVGGGGGIGGSATAKSAGLIGAVAVAIGANGGKGGKGGTVEVDNSSILSTDGEDAVGIFAQSIGGGGGRAGDANAAALAVAPPPYPAFSVTTSIGGSGGSGGNGDVVTVTNRADITTLGASAFGIQALSVGGGGGAAGSAVSTSDMLSLDGNIAIPIAVGGSGGDGGFGSDVTVTNKAKITTGGQFAFGISAQSIGGGGGSGGAIQTAAQVGLSWESGIGGSANDTVNDLVGLIPTADSVAASIGVGGSGGKGGKGGVVTVTNDGTIHTKATNATAIFAQSVGGGGGSGGGFIGSNDVTVSVAVNVGARGGDGGDGNTVTVKNAAGALIQTDQAGSHGIFAQSVGGGGGVGGGFTGKQKTFTDVNLKNGFALVKELLDVKKIYGDLKPEKPNVQQTDNEKKIEAWRKTTTREQKQAEFQKNTEAAFKAGTKLLKTMMDEDKSVVERLGRSAFIVGLAVAKKKYEQKIKDWQKSVESKQALNLPSAAVNVSVGGKGGKGGKGGDVTGENGGRLVTKGESSFGMFLQSVGGGGGTGGAAFASGENLMNVNVSVGGGGNDAGEGGTVKATNSGELTTSGALAYGILAQSIGGGGGLGGVSSNADTLSISGNVTIGGNSGKSSNGGVVEVKNTGKVTTTGDEAHAIVAQSIGGGGGVYYVHQADPTKQKESRADFADTPSPEAAEALKELTDILKRLGVEPVAPGNAIFNKDTTILPKPALNFSMGGNGGAGGSGDRVTVFHSGAIRTDGLASFGIFAQSVGGGGGLGGSAGGSGFGQYGYGLGGKGGTAGNGGDVTVTLGDKASIETKGDNSIAIFAQSVGGGGGYGGIGEIKADPFSAKARITDGGSSGDGGRVIVRMLNGSGEAMSITTSGTGAHGIYAQNLGGGGGLILNAKGTKLVADPSAIDKRTRAVGSGGEIEIRTAGTIETTGANAYGIFAQSGVQKADGTLDASRTGRNIIVDHSGTIRGGKEQGGAIRVDGGADNTITIKAGSTVEALSKIAITGTFGRETVDNYGTIIGAVDLAQGGSSERNGFNNNRDAIYRSLDGQGDIRIGIGQAFRNEGVFDIGGSEAIANTKLIGNFEQTSAGKLLVDFVNPVRNGGRTNDHLQVEGSAKLSGSIEPRANWLLPGDYRVLSATTGYTGAPGLTGPQANSVAIGWNIGTANSGVTLTPKADFVNVKGVALTDDQRSVARYLQSGWDTKAQRMGATFPRFLTTDTQSAYAAALDEMTSESAQYAANGKIVESRNALRFSMSCPAFTGAGTLLQEGECVWGRIGGARSRMSGSADEGGYRQNDLSYRIGGQKEFAPNWFIGGTASYTRSELKDPDGLTGTDSDSYDVSIALKHQVGNWLFAASGTIGKSDQAHLRAITIGTTGGRSRADSELYSAGARFRAAYEFAFENWYARPYLDLDVLHLQASSYAETGALGLDLAIRGQRKTLFAVNPNLEIGGRFELGTGYWVRPFGSVGFTLLSSDSYVTRASLVGAPAAIGSFETSSRIPDKLLDLGLGVQISSGAGFEVTGEYQAQAGKDYLSHTGSARLSWRF